MPLLTTALLYRDNGLCPIACNNKKFCGESWTPFQTRMPSDDELKQMFSGNANEIGIVGGKSSGNLGVIDVDLKYDKSGKLWDSLWPDIIEYFKGQPPLPLVETKNKGMHLYFRCDDLMGYQALARNQEGQPLIEVKERGGYVIAPPSPGYTLKTPGLLWDVPHIDADTRNDLYDICRRYTQVTPVEHKKRAESTSSQYLTAPWTAYDNDPAEPWRDLLINAGWAPTKKDSQKEYWKRPGSENPWGATWNYELGLFFVWTPSTIFPQGKAFAPSAIHAMLAHKGDYSKATQALIEAGYGEEFSIKHIKFINKQVEQPRLLTLEEIQRMLDFDFDEQVEPTIAKAIHSAVRQKRESKNGLFWKKEKSGIKLIPWRIKNLLDSMGFRRLVENQHSLAYRLVKIDYDSHIIREVDRTECKAAIVRWISQMDEEAYSITSEELHSEIITVSNSMWDNMVEYLETVTMNALTFLRDGIVDDKVTSWLLFKNGVVKITNDNIEFLRYFDLPPNSLVWSSQIRDFEISLLDVEHETDYNKCLVHRFMKRIAGITPDLENIPLSKLMHSHPDLFDRFKTFVTTAGYLMCNYKNPLTPFAVILAEDTADSNEGGGAGKGLFMKCIGRVRKICEIPAKKWDIDSTFSYQRVTLGDDIVFIDDVKKNFDFKSVYNDITDVMVIEKKHKDSLSIPFSLSPKIAISTNYDVITNATHAKRRSTKLMFASYYNDDVTPAQDLGGELFTNWKYDQDNFFFNVAFVYIQNYLDEGIHRGQLTEKGKAKSIKVAYSDEFYDFITTWLEANTGKYAHKKSLYEEFISDSGKSRSYRQDFFVRGLDAYAKAFGLQYHEVKNNSKVYGTRNAKYVIFVTNDSPLPPFVTDTIAESISTPSDSTTTPF